MIARALNVLGLMTVSEHEPIVDELDQVTYSQWRNAQTDLDKMDAKFKLAATGLAKQAEEIEEWKTLASDLGAIVEATKADALLWRNARDKRAKNRGGGK